MINIDPFDYHSAIYEQEFLEALVAAYDKVIAAIDIDDLTAAIEAGDEEAFAAVIGLDEGLHTGLDAALGGILFYAILGNMVLSMKRFASRQRSRVNPSAEVAQLREDIERNIIRPLARRAFDAVMTSYNELRKGDLAPRMMAETIIRSIALAPDQARSAAHFARAFHEAFNAPDRTVKGQAVTIPAATAKRIVQRHAQHLNAAQRSTLRNALSGELKQADIDSLIERHDRALADFRRSIIARQEATRAIHVGEYLAFKQGKANRSIPRDARRYWKTRGDERVRHDHRMVPVMNPHGIDVGQAFQTPLGPVMHPPLEVNCRCRVEVRSPKQSG